MNVTPHREGRRAALWLLYALDVAGGEPDQALRVARETLVELQEGSAEYWPEIEGRVRGVHQKLDDLNRIIQEVSPRWRVERMAHIDRTILRLGAWEILYGDVRPIAVIDACVDLAKEYGEKGTPAFVNGLLDQICRDHGIEIR
jgi:N utilization substance protein B